MAGWTLDEIRRLRQLHAEGYGRRRIAAELGRTRSSVRVRLRRLALMRQPNDSVWTPADVQRLEELRELGLHARQIAAQLGRTPQAVRYKAHLLNISLRGPSGRMRIRVGRVREETWQTLCDEAKRRGTTASLLVGRLLDLVVEDDLISAVLDTGVSPFWPRMPRLGPLAGARQST